MSDDDNTVTRRTLVAGAAVLGSTPALAQPREKGPPVWLDLDQKALDDAYDQAVYAPNRDIVLKRCVRNSELARERLGAPKRFAYGPTEIEALDVFTAKAPNAPINVFVRGVAWVYKNAKSFGGDPERLYVSGHSSGGHWVGVLLTTDWQKELGLPPTLIKGGVAGSGMFDLKAPRMSKRSAYVKFTD